MKIDKEVGFPELLFLVLLSLKLTGYYPYSWLWVLSPFWGYWALLLLWYGLERTIQDIRKPSP